MTDGARRRTIYDVAARAGASASTVSAVLSGSWRDRRISEATAARVREAAQAVGYAPNLQARALRQARSGLVGMILPEHENRFFSGLSQAFSTQAQARGQLPVLVATRRDPAEEARAARTLLAHSPDALIVAGSSVPEALDALCGPQGVARVFVDQPCRGAASVTTDNAGGMATLTGALLDEAGRRPMGARGVVLLGGDAGLPVTRARIEGFRATVTTRACGYGAQAAQAALAAERQRTGRLPGTLVVNSIPAFEGALRVLSELTEAEVASCAIGCFDHSPFLTALRFPVWMIRQRTGALIREAFAALDGGGPTLRSIAPELIVPRPARARHGGG